MNDLEYGSTMRPTFLQKYLDQHQAEKSAPPMMTPDEAADVLKGYVEDYKKNEPHAFEPGRTRDFPTEAVRALLAGYKAEKRDHAIWENRGTQTHYCSSCAGDLDIYSYQKALWGLPPFCPLCGAVMDNSGSLKQRGPAPGGEEGK